jgi:apolipoprotein N-acyltransferase
MSLISRQNLGQRLLQIFIFLAHILLLGWILYTLYEGGVLPFQTLLLHFLGISVYGAVLIRTCAWIYQRQYQKEQERHAGDNQLDP